MSKCCICGKDTHEGCITEDGEFVCVDCAHRGWIARCPDCSGFIVARDGVQRCNRCEEKLYMNSCNSYSTKPRPQFKNFKGEDGKEYKTRYYGLEMEFNYTPSDELHDIGYDLYKEKWIYNKHDGSIDEGVEVVTSPMDRKSVKVLLDRMKPMFDYIDGVDDDDYSYNAGLHIHVTKKSISPQDRYKLCILLNQRKNERERKLMYYLVGRSTKPLREDDDIYDRYYRIGGDDGFCPRPSSHHRALNVGNSATYEFRLFKSTTNKDVILSYLDIVDSMIEFCHIYGIKDITISNYIKYLKSTTKNKILIDKINTYEKKVGKIVSAPPILFNSEKIKLLTGIHWSDYPKIMYIISKKGYTDFRHIKDAVYYLSGVPELTVPKDELCEILNKTLRACLVKQIKKLGKELELCA